MVDPKITVNITSSNKLNINDSSEKLTSKIINGINQSTVHINDGMFGNPMMKTGAEDVALNAGEFSLDMITLNRNLITSVYHSCWIFRRIIDQGARDMLSKGIVITCDVDGDTLSKVYTRYNRVKHELIYAEGLARLYGGSASLMMVDDGCEDLSQPLKVKNIKKGSALRLYSTDRWYNLEASSEKVNNFNNIDYNTPKYYNFYIDNQNVTKVHHSRVLRFVNRRSPRYIEDRLSGWGISELEHIYQDLLGHENTKNASASLVNKALLEIVKVNGMRGMFSGLSMGNSNSQAQLSGQLAALNNYRSINNLVLMDANDQYESHEYSLGGLSELLETQEDFIAGAAEMPKVLLYGDTKGGLTSDSPAEMLFYADTIKGKQESDLRNPITKLLKVIFAVEGIPIPSNLDFEFESIVDVTDEKKQEMLNSCVDNCSKLMDMGLMTHETALEEIKAMSKKTGFGTMISAEDDKLAKDMDKNEEENPDEDETLSEDDNELIEQIKNNDYNEVQEQVLKKNKKFFDKLRKTSKTK
jgi:hypothetical protein